MLNKALTESLWDWQAVKAIARRVCSRSSKKKSANKESTYVSAFKDPITLSIIVYLFTIVGIHTLRCTRVADRPGSRNADQREFALQRSDECNKRWRLIQNLERTHTTVPEVHSEENDDDYGLRTEAVKRRIG